MDKENYISLLTICTYYKVEMDFIQELNENDLLEIAYQEKKPYIDSSVLVRLEKILRLHQDLQINLPGIGAIFNLLDQVDDLQSENQALKNRLKVYED